MSASELCGDETWLDSHHNAVMCNRVADPQPDGRRHRGRHWCRTETWGYAWNNRPPRVRTTVTPVVRTVLIGSGRSVFAYAQEHYLPTTWPMIPVHSPEKLWGLTTGDLKIIYMHDARTLRRWPEILQQVAVLCGKPDRHVTVAYDTPTTPHRGPGRPTNGPPLNPPESAPHEHEAQSPAQPVR